MLYNRNPYNFKGVLKNLSWIFCFLSFALYAENYSFEGRVGYFLPASELIKDVYHNGGVEPEVEAAFTINNGFKVWANFSAFYRKGRTEGLNDRTSIQIYPLSLGIKHDFKILDSLSLYLGVGPSFTWVVICNHSPYVQGRVSKTAWGVVGKSGLLFYLPHNIILDIFADYSYSRIGSISRSGVQSESVNVGGLRTGLGVGVAF